MNTSDNGSAEYKFNQICSIFPRVNMASRKGMVLYKRVPKYPMDQSYGVVIHAR